MSRKIILRIMKIILRIMKTILRIVKIILLRVGLETGYAERSRIFVQASAEGKPRLYYAVPLTKVHFI